MARDELGNKRRNELGEGSNGGQEATSYANILNEAREANKPTFDTLREQSAKDLLDSNIQTELARAAATKSLGTRMAAMGLGDSGYAGVAAGNIQNAYMQGMQGNKATYQDALRGIAMQEETQAKNDANVQQQRIWQLQDQETKHQYDKDLLDYEQALKDRSNEQTASTYRTENVVSNIAAATNQGNSDTLVKEQLALLGIDYSVGEGGKIELKGEGLANLSQGEQDSIKNALISKYETENPPLTSFEQLNTAGYKLPNGNGVDRIKDELDFLFNTKDGKALAKDGTLVKLENGNNNTDHMFLQYVRGGWRQVSEANAGNNYTLIKKGKIVSSSNENNKANDQDTDLKLLSILHTNNLSNSYSFDGDTYSTGAKIHLQGNGKNIYLKKGSDGKWSVISEQAYTNEGGFKKTIRG